MKKLLLTTALVLASSASAHAFGAAEAVKENLNTIYDNFNQDLSGITHGDDSAHGEYAELLYRIDNLGQFGHVNIDRTAVATVGLIGTTQDITFLGDATVDPDTGMFTLAQVIEQAEFFIERLLDETVSADNGFIQAELDSIIANLNVVNGKITDANNGVVNPDTGELYTQDEINTLRNDFVNDYNTRRIVFNESVTALVNISTQVQNIADATDDTDVVDFTIGGSLTERFTVNGRSYTSYVDYVIGDGDPTTVEHTINGSTYSVPISDNLQVITTGWTAGGITFTAEIRHPSGQNYGVDALDNVYLLGLGNDDIPDFTLDQAFIDSLLTP